MKQFIVFLCLAASVCFGAESSLYAKEPVVCPAYPPSKHSAHFVNVAEAEKLIAARKVVVLDVRTPAEFASGHIAGATNLNFKDKHFKAKLAKLNKSRSYLVHCATGGRSAKASDIMTELDFSSVYDLKGGIKAWEKAGEPVVK